MVATPSNQTGSPSLHSTLRWIVIAALGLLAAVLWSSPLSVEIYHLIHRGLRRHGFDLELKIWNRRPFGLNHDNKRLPVSMTTGEAQLIAAFGEPFYRLFSTRDRNKDGYLDPEEFRDFYRMIGPAELPRGKVHAKMVPKNSGNNVEIVALFEPLRIDSLTKEVEGRLATNIGYLKGLLSWKKPHRRRFRFPVADLVELLWPPEVRDLDVGHAYYILEGNKSNSKHLRAFPEFSNRYYLPSTFNHRREEILSTLIGAFHPKAFPYTRYEPSGSSAVVRAVNKDLVQIYFRLHAEFQLNEPPDYPFWFTPSYFVGQMTLTRNLSSVLEFSLDIPEERKLNVDMEWVQLNPASPFSSMVEVDIGYTSKMQLKLVHPTNIDRVVWHKRISTAKAFRLVEARLYPFKSIEYAKFGESFVRAAAEARLVHSVVLWGSLDDQSC